jgi:hypothetical protein
VSLRGTPECLGDESYMEPLGHSGHPRVPEGLGKSDIATWNLLQDTQGRPRVSWSDYLEPFDTQGHPSV